MCAYVGGPSMFAGFAERITKELTPYAEHVKVVVPPQGNYTVWRGGSMFASLPTFLNQCITTEEYNEEGPSIVHRKCIR